MTDKTAEQEIITLQQKEIALLRQLVSEQTLLAEKNELITEIRRQLAEVQFALGGVVIGRRYQDELAQKVDSKTDASDKR